MFIIGGKPNLGSGQKVLSQNPETTVSNLIFLKCSYYVVTKCIFEGSQLLIFFVLRDCKFKCSLLSTRGAFLTFIDKTVLKMSPFNGSYRQVIFLMPGEANGICRNRLCLFFAPPPLFHLAVNFLILFSFCVFFILFVLYLVYTYDIEQHQCCWHCLAVLSISIDSYKKHQQIRHRTSEQYVQSCFF